MTKNAPTESSDPTHCDICKTSLEGRAYCERWRGDQRIGVLCRDCDIKQKKAEFARTDVLTTGLSVEAALHAYRVEEGRVPRDPVLMRFHAAMDEVQAEVRLFEADVWYRGMRAKVKDAHFRGFSAPFQVYDTRHFDPAVTSTLPKLAAKAMCWSCAGRTMITLEFEDESAQITVITADDGMGAIMGIRGILATKQQALDLLVCARFALRGGAAFTRDDKVGMF